MPDLLEFDMRHVRRLVGGNYGVDDGRAVDGELLFFELDNPELRMSTRKK
jgi:hypothetical protein